MQNDTIMEQEFETTHSIGSYNFNEDQNFPDSTQNSEPKKIKISELVE